MSTKITGKGTELPLLNLKGKPYLQVAHRLVWFREDHPMGRIVTTVVSITDTSAVVKAEIYILGEKPNKEPFEILLATAHKKETEGNFGDFIEKAETGAIGRALGMSGYGTQYEPGFDEGDRLADSPVTPARRAATTAPTPISPKPSETPSPVRPKVPGGQTKETVLRKIEKISQIMVASTRATQEEVFNMLYAYGVKTKEELTDEQANKLLTQLEERNTNG